MHDGIEIFKAEPNSRTKVKTHKIESFRFGAKSEKLTNYGCG